MVKKMEHFWKGLSHDKTQISALPPTQYGDRFYSFVKDITMSQEEARRKELERERAEAEAAAVRSLEEALEEEEEEEGGHGLCPLGSHQGRGHHHHHHHHHAAPPMPTHQPPLPPNATAVVSEKDGGATTAHARDEEVVDHLPVVEEAGEASEKRPRTPALSERRPKTPAKDRPVTPRSLGGARGGKPESADSGYGGNGLELRPKVSRASLEKELPPLPGEAR